MMMTTTIDDWHFIIFRARKRKRIDKLAGDKAADIMKPQCRRGLIEEAINLFSCGCIVNPEGERERELRLMDILFFSLLLLNY